jgi:heme A synthase
VQAQNLVELGPAQVDRPATNVWFARFAGFLLAYLLFVIVFGAWVRITGSGAGCGDHWPTCHGELVPRAPSVQTLIEYTHRITSGVLGLLALGLPVWAFRQFPRKHPVRWFSVATCVLVMVEAGIGAGLVLRQLVALDASRSRAVVVALHLTNTLLLTAASALTVAFAQSGAARPPPGGARRPAAEAVLLVALLIGILLVAASGAVTALGDTLFPVNGAGGRVAPADHFLVELRVIHPILACFIVCGAILVALRLAQDPRYRFWARALGGMSALQLVMGALNITLNAPAWLQLGHLLGAQLAWLSAVLLVRAWYGPGAAPYAGLAPRALSARQV